MSLQVQPLRPDFVATVSGVDLSTPLGKETVRGIEQAIYKYAVLIFHDQHLSPEQLAAFAAQLGPLNTSLQKKPALKVHKVENRLKSESVTDLANVDASGNITADNHHQTTATVGNRFWHTDASYEHHPWRYSFLQAVTAVSWGGHTQFADIRAAYDSLDERTKDLIKDKVATFYSHNTRQWLGIQDREEALRTYPPVRWPMVRTHPNSGRKVLWCDSKVIEISGMSIPEGRALAHELIEHMGQREHVYSHAWKPGDIVMYDNRSVCHRGRRFDHSERRDMRRASTEDDSSSLGEIQPRSEPQRKQGEALRTGLD